MFGGCHSSPSISMEEATVEKKIGIADLVKAREMQKCRRGFVVGIIVHEVMRLEALAHDEIDALCCIQCLGHKFKTDIRPSVRERGRFEQRFQLRDKTISRSEDLQSAFINFEVQAALTFSRNDIVGSASLPLATVWQSASHAYVRKWLELRKENTVTAELLITAFCYGKGDTPPTQEDLERPELTLRVSGMAGPLCEFSARRYWTLEKLKSHVQEHTGIPAKQQRLLCGIEALSATDPFFHLPQTDVLDLTLLRDSEEAADARERLEREAEAGAARNEWAVYHRRMRRMRRSTLSDAVVAGRRTIRAVDHMTEGSVSAAASTLHRSTITAVDDIMEGVAYLYGAVGVGASNASFVSTSSDSDESSAGEGDADSEKGEEELKPNDMLETVRRFDPSPRELHPVKSDTESKGLSELRAFF